MSQIVFLVVVILLLIASPLMLPASATLIHAVSILWRNIAARRPATRPAAVRPAVSRALTDAAPATA